jgi:hypothetical protein
LPAVHALRFQAALIQKIAIAEQTILVRLENLISYDFEKHECHL